MTLDLISRILHRDGLILIIDKPAGIPVHQGPGGGDNLERHFDQLRFGLPSQPALAHRLDRDTSGCLVLGRHRKALAKLGRLFSEGNVVKKYWAIVHGVPEHNEGEINLPLKKLNNKSGWRMVVADDGQQSLTKYKVMGTAECNVDFLAARSADRASPELRPIAKSGDFAGDKIKISWLEFEPKTGRTHQIRVHAAAIGCPLVGEIQYIAKDAPKPEIKMHLHSRIIELPLYKNREPIIAVAPIPPHMQKLLHLCGYTEQNQLKTNN